MDIANPISRKRFLITGGAGFIGSHIVRFIIENGGFVRVLDNLLTGHIENIEEHRNSSNFEFIEGDITDLATCKKACVGIDYVCHQAALGSVPRSLLFPEKTNEINVSGFVNMLIAAKDNNVKRFVYASSSSVYGDEYSLPKVEAKIGAQLSPYAVSKYTNELYANVFAKSYGLETIGLRYFNIFGANQDPNGPYAAVIPLFISQLLQGQAININGDGKTTRDFTYVANAVQANIRALLTSNENACNEVYNIACGKNFSLLDLVASLEIATGKKAIIEHKDFRQGDIRDSLADISKAKNLLGYNPKVDFNQGIKETVASFLANQTIS
ncbi:MAG: SDR family oxidoreductase [Chitinophagales bacterium]|nr:SDR family oxidoreductase [Sphingobacteriales bacterium]